MNVNASCAALLALLLTACLCLADAPDAATRFPTFLRVPKTVAPAMDGRLDDPAWENAASFVTLVDLTVPEKSFSYPENRPLLCHDGQNLYVGFETLFPTGAKLIPGQVRGDIEPDIWPDESFEFYVDIDGRFYRFGGNAAGGYCESLNTDTGFDGEWEYVSSLEFRIDNRHHWQGEIRVPFETIGLSDPVGSELRINFCRTWRCLEQTGLTSLQSGTQNYGARETFVTIALAASGESALFSGSTDPSFGAFRQTLSLSGGQGGEFAYTLKVLDAAGDGQELIAQQVTVGAGQHAEAPIEVNITDGSAHLLLFEVSGPGGELLVRQLVPFGLSDDYLEVTPVFGSGRVLLKPRYTTLLGKSPGIAPAVRITGPDGRIVHQASISSDDLRTARFDRGNPVGAYLVELVSGAEDAVQVHTAKTIEYTGVGEWEELPRLGIVPAPFEPLRMSRSGEGFDVDIWGRQYRFDRSLLPGSIEATGRGLLSAPVQLSIDGKPVPMRRPEVQSTSDARIEFSSAGAAEGYSLSGQAWVEYDGVYYNRIMLHAERDLGRVELVVPLPRERARFLHATASGFGGGSRQNLWLDRSRELPFYPSVWIGDEEGGLAWFCESQAGWTTGDPRPIKVRPAGSRTRLQVTFADAVSAGSDLVIEFGLLATPVKPLPANYPLNTFADGHSVHLNPPPPGRQVVYSGEVSREGGGFFDLPLSEQNPANWQWLEENLARFEQNRAVFTPYTAAMMIPEEYPEAASRIAEWQIVPAAHLNYVRDDITRDWYWTCPASGAGDFFAWKFDQLLDRIPLRGIYLDFGPAYRCNNALHGCHDRYPLLAQRRLYQRLAASFIKHGVEDYVIVVHDSECVQWPTFTHVTHFLNGEGLRQMSSTTFHDGKDLQDTYTRLDFASEHSSLPWGVTCSVYVPTDPLLKEFGGGVEDQELYRFRMTKAALAGTLVHNTIPSPSRLHYGWFDKLARIYDEFGVPEAEFLPYWRNQQMVRVVRGRDIYVSLYRSRSRPEVLAVISHISPEHLNQNVEIEFDAAALGIGEWTGAQELLTAPDPEYVRLYAETNRIRMPIELGDFGVRNVQFDAPRLTMQMDFHSVAVVKLTGRR